MSALNLHGTTGIIYIVLIIVVACLFGLYVFTRYNIKSLTDQKNQAADLMEGRGYGGKRRKRKRQSK